MTNVISFTPRTKKRPAPVAVRPGNNVVYLAEWKKAPRPRRTPTGVYFTSVECGFSGDAA